MIDERALCVLIHLNMFAGVYSAAYGFGNAAPGFSAASRGGVHGPRVDGATSEAQLPLVLLAGHFFSSSALILNMLLVDGACAVRGTRDRVSHPARPVTADWIVQTPLWDVLFGTAHFPASGEWPTVGLVDVAEPKTH